VEVVRANGLEIAYRRAGQGPPMLLLHGAAGDGRIWQPQLAALADELTVVAWDEPGAAHVAGLSWGGTVRAGVLPPPPRGRRDPDPRRHLRGLEGLAARGGGARPVAHARGWWRRPPIGSIPRSPGFAGEPPARFAALLEMAAAFRPGEHVDAAVRDGRGRPARRAAPHRRADLIWGELDARSPLAVARQFERAIPDTTLTVIPGAGHVSNLERPERFNEAVREFRRAHRAPSMIP
jgi:pimeloyl-ACP methyl ester carboxylesterase